MIRALITAVPLLACRALASDCPPPGMTAQQTLARFQEIDHAAQAAFDAGRFADAARQYRDAACIAPKSARAFFGLGSSEAAAGNYAPARDAFQTASVLLPQSPLPLGMLVRVTVAMHDLPATKEFLRAAAEKFPNDAELHSGLARLLAENQMLDLALAESLRAEQAGRIDPESEVALAALENTVGAYPDALRHALNIESSRAEAQVRASAAGIAGLSYEARGERDEAIRHLKLAIEIAPRQENSYLALADLYEKTERFKEAAQVLQQGREHLATARALLLPLANNLVWAGQFDAGIKLLSEIVHDAPDTPEAYVRMAEAWRKLGQPERELAALRELARVKPDYPMLHLLVVQAMMTADSPDFRKVLDELALAQKSSPGDADVFYLRGKTYSELKQYPEAIMAFQRAIELRPLEPSAYYQLALLYRRTNNTALARENMERFECLQPKPTPR